MFNGSRNQASGIFLDPYFIGANHVNHARSEGVIRFEDSGRLFCPTCLEEYPPNNIDELDEQTFNNYIFRLLETLDQNGDLDSVRAILLKLLQVVFRKRVFILEDDTEFHNFLRFTYKLMKIPEFNSYDYSLLAEIFSTVSLHHIEQSSLPFLSIWQTSQSMLQYAEDKLAKFELNSMEDTENKSQQFIAGSLRIIKTCLQILGRFSINSAGVLVFPLFDNSLELYSRKYYIDGQLNCLKFMKNRIIPLCWHHFKSVEESLQKLGKTVVVDLFDALKECFSSSVRLKNQEFLSFLVDLDCLNVCHHLIYRNSDREFRNAIKSFVEKLILYYIEQYFPMEKSKEDEVFKQFTGMDEIVETNHRNAVSFSISSNKQCKTIFYLLANCVALKQKSKYYNRNRVKRVYKSIDLVKLNIHLSDILTKANLTNIVDIVGSYTEIDSIREFFENIWKRTRSNSKFNELFCFDRAVFFWIYGSDKFSQLVTEDTIESVTKRSLESKTILNDLKLLLDHQFYSHLLTQYLVQKKSAQSVIGEIVNHKSRPLDHNDSQEYLITEIGRLLHAKFQQSMVKSYNNSAIDDPIDHAQNLNLISLIVLMMKGVEQSKFNPDIQYINDIFKFSEVLYKSHDITEMAVDFLVQLNEFFAILMKNHSQCLMKVLMKLDYHLLGYMYDRLADYTKGDKLAESIAHLLLTYDTVDYPLLRNIRINLQPMLASIISWSFYGSKDLHVLSLITAPKLLTSAKASSTKTSVVTGLIHIVTNNPEILDDKNNLSTFLPLLELEIFKYHPMIDSLFQNNRISQSIRYQMSVKLDELEGTQRVDSPIAPFSPASSVSSFSDDQISVTHIINQLNNEVNRSVRIPENLFISEGTRDPHTVVNDIDDWELLARNADVADDMEN